MSERGRALAPSRQQVEEKLKALASGDVSRLDAALWAEQFDLDAVDDDAVFRALDQLSGADTPSIDRPYLYGQEDFRAWLDEFRRATASEEAA